MILLFLFFNLQAKANLQERTEILLHATNIRQLKKDLGNLDDIEILKQSCDLELSSKKVPRHCYLVLKSHPKASFTVKDLDDTCEENAGHSQDIVPVNDLSKICANFVALRNKEIEYSRKR
jgi:hypothetical protein